MTFLECINRILRLNAIIRGDTDTVSSFADTQHNASLNLARIAIETELIELVSDRLISKEFRTSGSLSLSNGVRVYDMPSNFIRLSGPPSFYDGTDNRRIYEYQGGRDALKDDVWDFTEQYGAPTWYYWEPGNTTYKQVAFFQIPNSAYNNRTITFDYEASVIPTVAADDLPFHSTEEAYTFSDMAGRRFKFMFEDTKNEADITSILMRDMAYKSAKTRLMNLLRSQNPAGVYGYSYV